MKGIVSWRERLEKALALEQPYPFRAMTEGRPAAVLLLMGFADAASTDPSVLVTRRTESVETHKGQYALPGGVMDPEDEAELGLVTTALRETEEEVGIPRGTVEVAGKLPEVWTPSGFLITPVVGLLNVPISAVSFAMSEAEIDHAFWVELATLRAPGIYRQEMRQIGAVKFPTDVFLVDGHRIWGATGAMLKNLIQRLERVE